MFIEWFACFKGLNFNDEIRRRGTYAKCIKRILLVLKLPNYSLERSALCKRIKLDENILQITLAQSDYYI